MAPEEHYIGQRLSLKGQACTIQYVGPVEGKGREWLGVEWDDPLRGRHNGTHEGRQYFQCRSTLPTAASFLRPGQPWDQSRTFLQALTEKYMARDALDATQETTYFSGKQAEEVGFDKFARRQAKLQGIHVLVLDRMKVKHRTPSEVEKRTITETCSAITALDLSGNLFETLGEIVKLCALFPKLQTLTLDRNRFNVHVLCGGSSLPTIRTLSASGVLLDHADQLNGLLSVFPSLQHFSYTHNELSSLQLSRPYANLETLDLSNNMFISIANIHGLDKHCPNLRSLLLQNNRISALGDNVALPPTLEEISLSHNAISSWSFIDDISQLHRPIRSLRIAGNPLYTDLRSAEDKPLTTADGYMLTIARLPHLQTLNYSSITEKERLNAETYYLGQIAVGLGLAAESEESAILARHPRYRALCEDYGEPSVQRRRGKEEIDPRSLAARLLDLRLNVAEDVLPSGKELVCSLEVPKSLDVYAVLGQVGKTLGVSPLALMLALETDEKELGARDSGYGGPEVWDSSDDEPEEDERLDDFSTRFVELAPSTRAIGTYVEGREARIAVRSK